MTQDGGKIGVRHDGEVDVVDVDGRRAGPLTGETTKVTSDRARATRAVHPAREARAELAPRTVWVGSSPRLARYMCGARRAALMVATGLALQMPLHVAFEAPAYAGAFEVSDSGWEGASELLEIARTELGSARVQVVATLNWDDVQPEDGVLAIHPLEPMSAEDTTAFMKAGGRLAILDDYGLGEETLKRFHIERTAAPSRPVAALRNRPSLAIAEPVVDIVAGRSQGKHPVVANVQQLVTNHPTGLRHPNLSPVLQIRAIGEPDTIIAVAGQVGKGRLFAMSDPSAAINQMLRYPGNRAFVAGLARYLVDDDGLQHRQGRLFIVTNKFSEEGSFGGQTTIRKDIESQLKSVASALADARREGFPGWVHVVLAALVAVGAALWVLRGSTRPYRSPLPRYARGVPLVAQGGVAGRFAVIAAPSSPRSLALLELKSALYEALTVRLDLAFEPPPDGLAKIARSAGALDESAYSALKDVLALMQQTENSLHAGRPAAVSRTALAKAARVVREVLAACGADGPRLTGGPRREGAAKPPGAESPSAPPPYNPSPKPHAGESPE